MKLSRSKNTPKNIPQTNNWRKVRPSFFSIDFAVFFTLLFALTLVTCIALSAGTFLEFIQRDMDSLQNDISKAKERAHGDQLWTMICCFTIIIYQVLTYAHLSGAWSVKEEFSFSPELFDLYLTSLGVLWCMLFMYPLVITWVNVVTHFVRHTYIYVKSIFVSMFL